MPGLSVRMIGLNPSAGYRLFTGKSVAEVMDRHRGSGPGFDLWRISLSLLVILLHSFHVSYEHPPHIATGPFGPVFAAVLPIFFSLSGFLVTGSALRTRSIRVFLSFRALRIIPALVTEVTLAALIIGPLLTTLPLIAYFNDPRTHVYFGNIIGWIHFALPGVFEHNPRPGVVNQNLWTLHPELICYAAMALLMATSLAYRRTFLTILWAIGTVAAAAINIRTDAWELHGTYPGPVLVYYFLTGIVAYHWRHLIPVNRWLFVVAVAVAYLLLKLPNTTFFAEPFLVYIMIFVGMQKMPSIGFLQRGDYSYGMYLYAYPIQQTLVLLFPATREWYYNFVLATVASLGVAMISWHLIEKPALSLKRFVRGRPKPIISTTEP
ncbi:acyltransferase family protein [Glacieibacterium megasporae]|uniref:acyltransferase family protein n=1 Tax=Glacieibacterium megasporae TaxID=2835787 RepID=UPI001C1E19F9|nr:acyltransferase [Polymorphobacter megasporae]UAJ12693.1 acyltransferase [Polymorphobacter megasporae]